MRFCDQNNSFNFSKKYSQISSINEFTPNKKLNEVEEEFYILRKRHAVGLVSLDIYKELQ